MKGSLDLRETEDKKDTRSDSASAADTHLFQEERAGACDFDFPVFAVTREIKESEASLVSPAT